jgi:hypothetical protein
MKTMIFSIIMILNGLYASGGLVAGLVSLPLDYVKTQLILNGKAEKRPLVQKFIGLDALFFRNALFFKLRHKIFKATKEEDKGLLIATTVFLGFFLSPLDNIVVKLQTHEGNQVSNIINTTNFILKSEGLKGLYIGAVANSLKIATFVVSGVVSNNTIFPFHVILWKYFLIMTAMIPQMAFSHPFDVIRTHLQRWEGKKCGILECTADLYGKYGIRGFYRGIVQAYARNCFIMGATVTSLEMYHHQN